MRLTIPDIPKSPNGPRGLLRMHWAARNRYNQTWAHLVRSQITAPHNPPKEKQIVSISQMRKRLLDEDNLAASCKPILDALVSWGIVKDDSPKFVKLDARQVVGKQKITIIDIRPYKPEEEVNA